MKDILCLKKERRLQGGTRLIFGFCFFLIYAFSTSQGLALMKTKIFGKNLMISGYINQSVAFGIAGDRWDCQDGFQSAIMQALVETEYWPTDNVKLFVTGLLNQDWAYPILENQSEWEKKHFKDAQAEQGLFSDYEDYLKECHITWTPGNWNFRIGKQIVNWGRMDGKRIMDQINPRDTRRGIADVEFETTIMPIWLIKAENYPEFQVPGFTDFALEFVFNPNADFISNKGFSTGNDTSGIWASDAIKYGMRIGTQIKLLEKPDSWDADGFEYGFRIKGTLGTRTYFTLNYFDGVANSPVAKPTGGFSFYPYTDDEGRMIMSPEFEGFYGDQRFAGLTFTYDTETFSSKTLGGVAPVLRCEARYTFGSEYRTDGKAALLGLPSSGESFETYDEIYYGIGIDWKFRCRTLNPTNYISFSPEFAHKYVLDYPSDYVLRTENDAAAMEEQYEMSLMIRSDYLHNKLVPMIFYMHEIQGHLGGDMILLKMTYTPNSTWKYQLASYFLNGELWETGGEVYGTRGLDNKDHISFTVQYQF